MSNLTPAQIIEWFRSQAEEFTRIADTLEATFKGGAPAPAVLRYKRVIDSPEVQSPPVPPPSDSILTVEAVKAAMPVGQGIRIGALAAKIGGGVTPEEVRAIVWKNESLFERGAKGWFTLKPTQ